MVCENITANGTSILANSQPTHWMHTLVAFVITLFILGNNIITIIVIAREKSFWNASGYFMAQLAVVDLTTGIFLTLFSVPASIMNEWPFGQTFCSIAGLIGTSGGSLSISSLALIAYDRYLLITKPLHYETIMTKKKAIILMAVIWVFNLAFQAMPFAVPTWTTEKRYLYFPNSYVCSFAFHNNLLYVMLSIGLIFLPACTVINFCCFKMYMTARSHAKAIQSQNTAASSDEAKRSAKNINALKTVTLIVGAFFFAWGPFMIFCVYRAGLPCEEIQNVPRALEYTVGMFAMANSCVNFFIYSVRNRKFRESAKKALFFGKCMEKAQTGDPPNSYSTGARTHKVQPSASYNIH